MDALMKTRKQRRRLFTKACNDFENEEDKLDIPNKITKLKIIEEKAILMIETEGKIREQLYVDSEIKEEELELEIDASEAYIDRWRFFEQKLKQLSLSDKVDLASNFDASPKNTLLRYPKIQLPSFNGDIRNWLCFWGQFQKVDKDPNLDLHDKFSYLSQAMVKGSVAEELIRSFPPGGDSYEKALNQLRNRFGREELLIQVYVRDLLALVLQKDATQRKSLRVLYDLLETKLRALEILGVTRDKYASMLFPLIESSLPEETLRAWERFRSTNRRSREIILEDEQHSTTSEKGDLTSILEFLQDEVEAEERILLACQSFDISKVKTNTRGDGKHYIEKKTAKLKFGNTAQVPTAADLLTSSRVQRQCIFCLNSHSSADCAKVRKMPLKERETITGRSRCCFLCLKPGHQVRQCNVKAGCLSCGKRHHILLCRSINQQAPSPSENVVASEKKLQQDHALANVSKSPNVMLQTLKVIIRGNGRKRAARAILDTASQRSYLLRDTAREMAYKPESYEHLQHSLFGGNSTEVCKHDVFTLYLSSADETYNCNFKVLSQQIICESRPPVAPEHCLKALAELDIHVIDDCEGPIEVLIGADVAGKLMTGGHRLLPCGLAAIETRLGWTVMGRLPQTSQSKSSSLVVTSMLSRVESITDLWTLDTLGITDPSVKKSKLELEKSAKQHFLDTVEVKNDRFMVHLPWLEDHPPLPDYYHVALKRLDATIKRLKSESLCESYEEVFNEWLRDEIIEEVKDEPGQPAVYLPHRPVIKENSSTKIRPVFDASTKEKGSPSLNDCLEKGQNLIEMIPSILTRFRKEKIGVISDIRKAFLQISLSPNDRNYLRFLWKTSDGELKIYRHCRVVFGVSSSPFLLGSTIQYHLQTVLEKIQDGESPYPFWAVQELLNSFYVDNCVHSVKSERELNIFIETSTRVMAERKFELRGWEYTDPDAEAPTDSNVLGIIWDKKSDTLRISTRSLKELCFEKVTKRIILSAAHKLFDPIGIICPVILMPKLLLQETWKMKITWDEEVDSNTKNKFLKWLTNIAYLEDIHFPRYFGAESNSENCSIHFFCDASKRAYAVVVFIRIETLDSVKVQLLQARSRVAPTGKDEITIPRLELLAATIASRLSSTILPEMQCKEVHFWTDSSNVLAWITREDAWGVFVQNRVKEIKSLTNKNLWRYVPGIMNPADLPSRGCSAQYLLKSKWWEGPSWLYSPPENWPAIDVIFDEKEVNKEKKKGVVSSVPKYSVSACSTIARDWYYRHFSKYTKIIDLVAWILRFIFNCRSTETERKHGNLHPQEIIEAEKKIIQMVQEDCFVNERDEKLKTLKTFKDENGIIRLKTKLTFRQDTEDFRTPIVLPSQHEVVKRLILYYHEKHAHAGTQMLINILRENFWILNARKTVRSVVFKCITCKRFSSKKLDTVTAPLPEDRVREAAVFEICGIDMAGPLLLRTSEKSWICIFTCAVYRAVHFELVTSLTTEGFLQALRRFIARRGRCKVIYCDNGTNFVGASNLLRNLDWTLIANSTAVSSIHWKFNPPTASWWGGWWERLIGVLKKLLRRVLGRASLTYEEMTTVLYDCESVINSRPLTYLAENNAELIPLSPALFLQDVRTSGVPDLDTIDHKSLNKRLRYRQNLRKDLRQRFRSEYLGALIQRSENKRPSKISIGDVVLIGSDNAKRTDWPLGKVLDILPGKEGITRLVKLQTAHGQLLRPIQRLYPLEISASDPIVEKKLSAQTARSQPSDDIVCNRDLPVNKVKSTRCGRIVKVPQRLDL